MLSWSLLVIATALWGTGLAAALDVEVALGVASVLQRHFRAGCVFLVPPPGLPTLGWGRAMVRLQAGLAAQGVSAAARPLDAALPGLRCRRNRPLLILLGKGALAPLRQMNTTLSSARWLLLEAGENQDAASLLDGVHVPFDCEFVVARGVVGGGASLSEVYGVLRGRALHVATFGSWSARQGLVVPGGGLYRRRNDLHGVALPATVNQDPPFQDVTVRGDGSVDSRGFFSEVWRHLQHRLNFTTKLVLIAGTTAGSRLQNGSWTGLAGQLMRGEALLSYNRVTMTASRAAVLDYSVPVLRTKACVFLRLSDKAHSWNSYTEPFQGALWLSVSVLGLLIAAVLWLVRYQPLESALLVCGSFCAQGHEPFPRACSARLVIWLSQFAAVTLLAAYSGTLMSHAAVCSNTLPFSSLRGLLRHGGYRLGVTARSGVFTNFESATDPVLQEAYHRLLLPNLEQLPTSRLQGLQNACRCPHYAFMVNQDFVAGLGRRKIGCRLTELPHGCFPISMGLALAKGAGLRGVINYHLQEMRRVGLLRVLYLRHWPQMPPPAPPPLPSVGLPNVLPLLCVLAVGGGIAAALLLLEAVVFSGGSERNL